MLERLPVRAAGQQVVVPLGVGGGDYVVGVTLNTGNADLMEKLVRTLGTKQPYFHGGATLTYIISGADGGA